MMARGLIAVLFFLVLAGTGLAAGSGFIFQAPPPQAVQTAPQAVQTAPPGPQGAPQAVQPVPQVTPAPETKPDPVEIKDGLISVSSRDETLGSLVSNIGRKTGINVIVHPSLSGKKITTSFSGLDFEQSIRRILALGGASNYRILYNDKGAVAALKVYKESSDNHQRPVARNQPPQGFPDPQLAGRGSASRRVSPTRFSRRRPAPAVSGPASALSSKGGEGELPPELLNAPDEELELEEPLEENFTNPFSP